MSRRQPLLSLPQPQHLLLAGIGGALIGSQHSLQAITQLGGRYDVGLIRGRLRWLGEEFDLPRSPEPRTLESRGYTLDRQPRVRCFI